LHKTEELAYNWLLRKGWKPEDIVYQRIKTPDFLTRKGNFEVKRAYITKKGNVKILLTDRQIEQIQKNDAKILVFTENKEEPIAIIEPSQTSQAIVGEVMISKITYKSGMNLNIDLDDKTFWRFHEVKTKLKAKTNVDCLKKLLELVK